VTRGDQSFGSRISGCSSAAYTSSIASFLMQQPELTPLVLSHFVGAGVRSDDVSYSLRRLCAKLGFQTRAQKRDELVVAFSQALTDSSKERRVVIILDGVDQFSHTPEFYDPLWFPRTLPENSRIILSARSDDVIECSRSQLADSKVVTLGELKPADSALIIADFLRRYQKSLQGDQLTGLLAKTDAVLPLYLLAALEELRTLGTYDQITDRIHMLPADALALFQWIFKRLENDDGFRDTSGNTIGRFLVPSVASFITASRHGLSEHDLDTILATAHPNYSSNKETSTTRTGLLSVLLRLLRPNLMYRAELIDFCHLQIREAATALYLSSDAKRRSAHATLGFYFLCILRSQQTVERSRAAKELLYHLRSAGLWDEIVRCLADSHIFDRLPPASFGISYDGGTFTATDDDGLTSQSLQDLPIQERKRTALAIAKIFAMRARYCLSQAMLFERPWALTAYRLEATDPEAFYGFRDVFYNFMLYADRAFVFARIACEGNSVLSREFLYKWSDVTAYAERFERRGHEITGLSHQIEDLGSFIALRGLMEASGLHHSQLGWGDKIGAIDWTMFGGVPLLDKPIHKERQAQNRGGSDEEAAATARMWANDAQDVLQRIDARFDLMKWNAANPPNAGVFESDIKRLVSEMPALPETASRAVLLLALNKCFHRSIFQGMPIPDEYQYIPIFPEPGSVLGRGGRLVAACIRIDLFVTVSTLEGYGELSTGVLVQPEVKYR
jgi:hypothetical protein